LTSPVRAIVTHPTPDLDALLCVYLLRRYGEPRIEGVGECPLQFMSPNEVEEAGGAEALEERGYLLVDLGGGRFDNHPRPGSDGDLDASAAELVADHLGVRGEGELSKILAFCARQDLKGESLRSRDPVDHAVALPAIIEGANQLHPTDSAAVYAMLEPVLDAIIATERGWYDALRDAEQAMRAEVGGAAVLGMESASKAAARAGRYSGADLLVVRYLPHGHVAFTARRQGPLRTMTLDGLAARVRRAEAEMQGLPPSGDLRAVGMHGGWFLHQSRRILNKGSPKAPDVPITVLDLSQLHALAVEEVAVFRRRGRR
jgi:hypothetical protein